MPTYRKRRYPAWQAAIDVLRETDNPAVMWGDSGLLHLIAKRLGWKAEAWHTEDRVIRALNQTPGPLIKDKTRLPNGRTVSIFRLRKPEETPMFPVIQKSS